MQGEEHPIKDYAIIGNCETAALINSSGGIDWLCLPSFDAPSFFGALLDREKGGEFVIRPFGDYRVDRRYLGDTAILETRFTTARGVVLLTDFFVIAREPRARFYDFTSLHPTKKLVRLIRLEHGESVTLQLHLNARPDYARRTAAWTRIEGGFECAEAAFFSDVPLKQTGTGIGAEWKLQRGARFHAVVDYSENRRAPQANQIDGWLGVTRAFWNEWALFNYYRGPHSNIIKRSAVTLKLLMYAPTGAMVAAPTTSLPEKPGGDRNWDYRYTWLRDTALVINALFRLGYSGEAKAFFQFVTEKHRETVKASGQTGLPVLLPIRDESCPDEERLDHLAGYQASRPVRRGNRAADHLQVDSYGYFLQSLYYWRHTGGQFDESKRRMACDALAALRRYWREPDNGIWEEVERKQHTHSKVSAWLAFERARDLGLVQEAEATALCREIYEETMKHGVHQNSERDYLVAHYDADTVDCAALLGFSAGFLPHPLARTTREEIESRLAVGPRAGANPGPLNVSEPANKAYSSSSRESEGRSEGPWLYRSEVHRKSSEGAFVLCSFWWIQQLIREGSLRRAERLLDEVIAAASPLGLYSEEINPDTGEFLGNFPQAFSHLGLVTTILDLEEAKAEPASASVPDHIKFRQSVGPTIGLKGIIAGFFRVPGTLRLLFSRRSKWRKHFAPS